MDNLLKDKIIELLNESEKIKENETHKYGFTYVFGPQLNNWMKSCNQVLTTYFKSSTAFVQFDKEKNYMNGGIEIKRFDALVESLKKIID